MASVLPFQRAISVTMHLSGTLVRFTVDHLEFDAADGVKLTRLTWTGARDAPFYFDPTKIEAIETRRIWRRRIG